MKDLVGKYWFEHFSRGTLSWIFARLTPEDRLEVHSNCFQNAQFDKYGMLACRCEPVKMLKKGSDTSHCAEEYWCEEFAACLLMPREDILKAIDQLMADECDPDQLVKILAAHYEVEEWTIRYRIVLLDAGSLGADRMAEFMASATPEQVKELRQSAKVTQGG